MSSIWQSSLLPASFNGVEFFVEQSSITCGPRNAIHEFPYKNFPTVEVMGQANMVFSFTGFLVSDLVGLQEAAFISTVKSPPNGLANSLLSLIGYTGLLVHPHLGPINAACLSATFIESKDRGRVVGVELQFLAVDEPLVTSSSILTTVVSSVFQVVTAVTTAMAAITAVYAATVATALGVIGTVSTVVSTVTGFATGFTSILTDAGMVFGASNGVQSLLGANSFTSSFALSRYTAGNVDPSTNPVLTTVDKTLAPAALIATATAAMLDNLTDQRAALLTAVQTATDLAATMPTDPTNAFLAAVEAMTEALRACLNDPRDQIRLLASLASFQGATFTGTDNISMANQTLNDAVAAACRRAALFSLALACSQFQPTVADDVIAILDLVIPLFQNEIEYAGDTGDAATYSAFESLIAAVVADLQLRGSNLPSLTTFTEPTNLPSLVLAAKLYQDVSRADDLVARVNPIHPAFFPLQFQALSA